MKNAHLRRYPDPSPCQAWGRLIAAYCKVRPPAGSPTRRRGKKTLLIRRDATLRISGALHLDIFDQPEKVFFAKSCHCSTRKPFINHKASAIISINFLLREGSVPVKTETESLVSPPIDKRYVNGRRKYQWRKRKFMRNIRNI
jgi:hypothetical protein